MRVYVLTSEPYHDNGSIHGVYLNEESALAELTKEMTTTETNADDMRVTEWDVLENKELRRWDKYGDQEYGVVDYGRGPTRGPVRVNFRLEGPT